MSSATLLERGRYWVIVADASKAEFYTRTKKFSPMKKSFALENPDARKKTAERLSDTGGRSFDSHGEGRHMLTQSVGPKETEAQRFSKIVADHLNKLQKNDSNVSITLVAAPRFLGQLRKSIGSSLDVKPHRTIAKDMLGHSEERIVKLLDEYEQK